MSDTPRTDSLTNPLTGIKPTIYVVFEHARQLERENEALRKDAERYRWLREFGARARIYFPANRGTEMEIATAEKLDSAIDAAIKEQTKCS
jgi:hypothetical protein